MKDYNSFFRISHEETRRFIVLLAIVEAIALLIECAKLSGEGRINQSLLLFMIGAIGILLVDWFFNKAIERYRWIA